MNHVKYTIIAITAFLLITLYCVMEGENPPVIQTNKKQPIEDTQPKHSKTIEQKEIDLSDKKWHRVTSPMIVNDVVEYKVPPGSKLKLFLDSNDENNPNVREYVRDPNDVILKINVAQKHRVIYSEGNVEIRLIETDEDFTNKIKNGDFHN